MTDAADHDLVDIGDVVAGEIGAVLDSLVGAVGDGTGSDVPCGSCTACCRSSQFIDVGPDETDALAHIPAELLFPAPGRPPGHRVMGYDESGCCPMLRDDACSIYEHRPQACRVYDCRIFAVAGVEPVDQPLVAVRVRRWRFTADSPTSTARAGAVRRAAISLARPGRPVGPTVIAVTAVEDHERLLADEPRVAASGPSLRPPDDSS